MTTGTAPQSPSRPVSEPKAGSVVGGRFEVIDLAYEDRFGHMVRARDTKTSRTVALRLLNATWSADPASIEALRQQIKLGTQVRHRGIASTYGMGRVGDRGHYVVGEWLEGQPLSQLIATRRQEGRSFSLRATYNIVTHVAKALADAHRHLAHGGLRPEVVWLSGAGRVRVAELGLAAAMGLSGAWQRLSPQEQACLAPEVRAGQPPDARTDMFGLGALLYVLLTNRFPHEDFIPPSSAHPDAGQRLDDIVLRCLSQDPNARYESPLELIRDLMPLVGAAPEPAVDEADFDVEIDVDIAASLPPPAPPGGPVAHWTPQAAPASDVLAPQPVPRQAALAPAPPRPAPAPAPSAPRAAPGASPIASPNPTTATTADAPRASEVDFSQLLAKITENDSPRWMVVKDDLDHGPFSGRELVQLILKGEVLEKHGLLNLDTGERRLVREFPELTEFLQQYKLRKAEQDHQEALVRTDKSEKRSNVAKFVILAGAVGVLGMVAVGYLLTRPEAQEERIAEGDLADLYESGQVKIEGTVGILKSGANRGNRKSGRRRTGGPGSGASYEDAMNQAMDLGDAKHGGGERQLTSNVIAGVMNGKLNSLFGCVSNELRSGGRLGTVKIDLAIAGNGKVLGSSVHAGSPAFKSCISGKIRHITFPSFPAARMGARYSFNVD